MITTRPLPDKRFGYSLGPTSSTGIDRHLLSIKSLWKKSLECVCYVTHLWLTADACQSLAAGQHYWFHVFTWTHYCVLITHEPQGNYLGKYLIQCGFFSQNDGHYLTWCQEVSAWISWPKNRTTGGLKLITKMGREKTTKLLFGSHTQSAPHKNSIYDLNIDTFDISFNFVLYYLTKWIKNAVFFL